MKQAFEKLQSESLEREKEFQDKVDVKFLELSQTMYRAGDSQKQNKIRQELFELGKTPVPPDEQITPLERDQLDFFQKSPGIGMVFLFVTFVISKVDLGASVLAAMGKDLKKEASLIEDGDHKDSKSDKTTGNGSHSPDFGDSDQDEDGEQHQNPEDTDENEKGESSSTDKGQALQKHTTPVPEQKGNKEQGAIIKLVNRVWNGIKVFLSCVLPLVLLASQFAYIFLIFYEAYVPYRDSQHLVYPKNSTSSAFLNSSALSNATNATNATSSTNATNATNVTAAASNSSNASYADSFAPFNSTAGVCPGYDISNRQITDYPAGADAKVKLLTFFACLGEHRYLSPLHWI